MNKIEWDTVDGILEEADLWKLFSDHPDKPSEAILFFSQIKPLLSKMRFEDDTRFYHVYEHGTVSESPDGVGNRATVTQRNLRRVANAIAGRGNSDAAIQYLGAREVEGAPQQASGGKRRERPMPPAKGDSVDKIVTNYFAALTAEPFEWRGKTYEPRDLWVSPGIVRGFTCPAGCGGCCRRWSLDYIEPDGVPTGHPLATRAVEFNGREVEVWSDMQKDHKEEMCRNLNLDNGRCNIHGSQPFSCDFELLRAILKKDGSRAEFYQRLFMRGWNMKRVDGERGALCEMTEPSPESVADVDRRLARLETWMQHFGLNPVRVGKIRAALPEIAASGKGFSITE